MKRLLYHGSTKIIPQPTFGVGNPFNDYGLGFYCTEVADMAREWAPSETEDGYVNCYELDDSNLKILNLNDGSYCLLHWLNLLLQNRHFSTPSLVAQEAKEYFAKNYAVDAEAFDCIVGYRADDSYFSFAQDFLNGTISYSQLKRAMYLGNLGEQYALKSPAAFESILFLGFENAPRNPWHSKRIRRDTEARRHYFDQERNARVPGEMNIFTILDQEVMPDDPRL